MPDALVNVALYVPLGFFLGRRGARSAFLIALTLSVLSECLQLFSPYRYPGVGDVLCNVGGAVLGWAAAQLVGSLESIRLGRLWSAIFLAVGLWFGFDYNSILGLISTSTGLWHPVLNLGELPQAAAVGFFFALSVLSRFATDALLPRWILCGMAGTAGGILVFEFLMLARHGSLPIAIGTLGGVLALPVTRVSRGPRGDELPR